MDKNSKQPSKFKLDEMGWTIVLIFVWMLVYYLTNQCNG